MNGRMNARKHILTANVDVQIQATIGYTLFWRSWTSLLVD